MHAADRAGIISEWSEDRKVPTGFEKEIREMLDILGTDEALSYRELIAALRTGGAPAVEAFERWAS